ncbi:MAG: DUF4351 domain-containing protein [Goleter apudmare HA4340-LM2]|nr:DUF4351 domain-containing protein [Goleter apudmare HA4340-LM2]
MLKQVEALSLEQLEDLGEALLDLTSLTGLRSPVCQVEIWAFTECVRSAFTQYSEAIAHCNEAALSPATYPLLANPWISY